LSGSKELRETHEESGKGDNNIDVKEIRRS